MQQYAFDGCAVCTGNGGRYCDSGPASRNHVNHFCVSPETADALPDFCSWISSCGSAPARPGLCFSGDTTVDVLGKGTTRMDQLDVGDKVLGADGTYTTVYSFGHLDAGLLTDFVQIYTSNKQPLEMTGDHLLYVYNETTGRKSLVPAGQVTIGDLLITSESAAPAQVQSVRMIQSQGIYAPFTSTGDIVVNGIVTSNYIALPPCFQRHFLSYNQQHWVQHVTYTPYRLYCLAVECKQETRDSFGFPVGVKMWLPLLEWLEVQQHVLPAFLYFVGWPCLCFLWLFEKVILNPIHTVAALLGYYFLWTRRYKRIGIQNPKKQTVLQK